MRKLVIDRTKWLRGEGADESRLRRERDGKMCCLGFYSIACGFSEEQITGVHYPVGLRNIEVPFPEEMQWTLQNAPNLAGKLAQINDFGQDEDENTREAKIIDRFAAVDVEVEFIN